MIIFILMKYEFLLIFVMTVCSVTCSIQDIKNRCFKVWHIGLSFFLVIMIYLFFNSGIILFRLLSSLCFALFYMIIREFTKRKMGTGDILFAAFQGLLLSIRSLPVCTLLSVFAALIFSFILQNWNNAVMKKSIPFVPFMSFGLIASYFITGKKF